MFWAILTTVAFGLAAIAILINWQARLAMRLMALTLGLFGVLVWVIALPKGFHLVRMRADNPCYRSYLDGG